jgi:hypothetical protein
MAKFPKPNNFDEIRKRGGSDRHIVKQVADMALEGGLDSDREDEILEGYMNDIKEKNDSLFYPYNGHYPPISGNRLQEYHLIYKEVRLNGYRIDSIIRTAGGRWILAEVKTKKGLNLGVIGHLLSKRAQFEKIFKINSANIENIILTDGCDESFRSVISDVNTQYDLDIHIDEYQPNNT